MTIICPKCKQEYDVDPDVVGHQVQCESCGLGFIAKARLQAKSEQVEETLVRANPSGWYFFWYYFLGCLFLLGIWGIVLIIVGLIKQYCTHYEVTNRRVIVRKGWLNKKQTEVWIKDIRGVAIEANIWERIIGTGSVAIGTAATAKAEITMAGIKKPKDVVAKINEIRGRY